MAKGLQISRGLEIRIEDFPENKRNYLLETLEVLSPIIPVEYRRVIVVANNQPENGEYVAASAYPQPEYKQAMIGVFPAFWDSDVSDKQRFEILAHELTHLHIQRLYEVASNAIEAAFPEPGPFRDFALQSLCEENERTTTNLSLAFAQYLFESDLLDLLGYEPATD